MSNKKLILGIAAGVAALAVVGIILKRKGYLDGVIEKAEEFGSDIADKYSNVKESAKKPRRRAPLYFGGAEHPEPSAPSLQAVIPANAGIQRLQAFSHERPWIPAFAGMTRCGNVGTGDW